MNLNISLERYVKKLREELSEKRYNHSMRVMETCESLAKQYNQNVEKAMIAGLLHDCAREAADDELKKMIVNSSIQINEVEEMQPMLLHAKGSAIYAKEKYGITDIEILDAIACHTTGKPYMTEIDKIVFLADYIEPGRKFPGVDEVRNMAYNDIEGALATAFKNTIIHVVGREKMLHPDTVNAYNWSLYLVTRTN